MKIGLFGGTFDPVHHGHLIVAEYVREKTGLDRIAFVPAAIPPHKREAQIAPALDRLAMLREAIRSDPFFEVSDVEVARGGVSFTVETLRILRELNPSEEYHLMIGVDNIAEFHLWKEPQEILRLAKLIVMNRPGFSGGLIDPPVLAGAIQCDVPGIDISATEIRRRVEGGLPISYLVPQAVARYIARHHLYRRTG